MKKQITTIILLIAFGLMTYSANAQTELIYDGGVYQNGIKLTAKEVRELFKDDSVALDKYESGRESYVFGIVIGCPFTILTGLGVYCLYDGIKNNIGFGRAVGTIFTVMGGTGMLIGIVCILAGPNRMKEAVGIYNTNINNKKVSVNFGFTGNGVGLSIGV